MASPLLSGIRSEEHRGGLEQVALRPIPQGRRNDESSFRRSRLSYACSKTITASPRRYLPDFDPRSSFKVTVASFCPRNVDRVVEVWRFGRFGQLDRSYGQRNWPRSVGFGLEPLLKAGTRTKERHPGGEARVFWGVEADKLRGLRKVPAVLRSPQESHRDGSSEAYGAYYRSRWNLRSTHREERTLQGGQHVFHRGRAACGESVGVLLWKVASYVQHSTSTGLANITGYGWGPIGYKNTWIFVPIRQQYGIEEKMRGIPMGTGLSRQYVFFFNKSLNASRPCEHPPVKGGTVKTFRWDHRLQRHNLFMAFKRVPL